MNDFRKFNKYLRGEEKSKEDKINEGKLHMSEDCKLFLWDGEEKMEINQTLDLIGEEVKEIIETIKELNASCHSAAPDGFLNVAGSGGSAGENVHIFPL